MPGVHGNQGGFHAETEEGQQNSLAAISDPQVSVKHGLHLAGTALMNCDKCAVRGRCPECTKGADCALERRYWGSRRQELLALDGVTSQDGALIESAILAEVRLARAARYAGMAEVAPGLEKGYWEYTPGAREIPRLQKEVREALDVLCATPKARARMAVQDTGNGAAAILSAFAEVAKGRGDVAEGDEVDLREWRAPARLPCRGRLP